MGEDKETRQRLIDSAKAEFCENGYAKASLRKICANASVTTGALYFFFKNKDDLFSAIVEPPLEQLRRILEEHNREDERAMGEGVSAVPPDSMMDEHGSIADMIVDFLYDNYDEFLLLLTKAQGSEYENAADEFVGIMEEGFRTSAQALLRNLPGYRIDEYMIHWLAHMDLDVYIHLLTHETDRERAKQHSRRIMDSIVESWFRLVITNQ